MEFKIVARKFPSLCPFHTPLFFSITEDFHQEASMKRNVVDTSQKETSISRAMLIKGPLFLANCLVPIDIYKGY